LPTKSIELMLAGWDESHAGGRKVTFWVADDDEFQYFKNATVRKGKVAGQRYQTVFVQLTDDDKPDKASLEPAREPAKGIVQTSVGPRGTGLVDEPAKSAAKKRGGGHFPDGLCGLAVMWCEEKHFQDWLASEFPEEWNTAAQKVFGKSPPFVATQVLYDMFEITTRKALDEDKEVGGQFRDVIMLPYKEQRKADGIQ
jgi:hypothetical protein